MATEILAIGTTAADSSDVVVTTGLTVCLKDAAGTEVSPNALVDIQLKDDAGQYFTIGALSGAKPMATIGAGTWRFSRYAPTSCGVFSEAAGAASSQTQGTVASGAADSGNPVKVAGVHNTTLPTFSNGQRADAQSGITGAWYATLGILGSLTARGLSSSSAIINLASRTSASLATGFAVFPYKFNGTTNDLDVKPNAVGRLPSSAASVNATNVKGSAGDVFFIGGNNANAAIRYLKLYNKATAPTVGTDTPFMTFALKPLEPFNIPLGGIYFSLGIGYGLTTGAADSDTGAVAAGDILGLNIAYA